MKETLRGVTSLGTELRQEQSFCRERGRSELIVEKMEGGESESVQDRD
jgi:hypothetical protein